MEIKTVTVIGANGTMGANVSGIFASFGNATVYMVSRELNKSLKAIEKASKSVRAQNIVNNLIPADYSELEKCIAKSDIVFESVAENMEIKIEINRRISASLREGAIACTGTSGLSITELSKCFTKEQRKNYFGMHFFNPPYNLTFCELISTEDTDPALVKEIAVYLETDLRRSVIFAKDMPAFLGNRIGFQFINEAMQYAEKYKDNGGIDYIDAILGSFTGRAMPPLKTADFVGIDVHKAIVENIYDNSCDYAHETFVLPEFARELIEKGMLGKKTGSGLYKTELFEDGRKVHKVYDIATKTFRNMKKYNFDFAAKMVEALSIGNYDEAIYALVSDESFEAKLCTELLFKYITYSVSTALEVSSDVSAADCAMATGFNWCPPLAMAQAFSKVCDLESAVCKALDGKISAGVNLKKILSKIKPSKYDYRPYFKAVR